jgi:hypothetical protein
LYFELAEWWPLFSPPEDYVEEAADLLPVVLDGSNAGRLTLLELGSGGGSLVSHWRDRFEMTLTDRSPAMLEVNKRVNPECEHICGDMTTLNLGRQFDRVLLQDAVMYLTTPEMVRAAIATAARHCRSDGRVIAVPDCVRETLEPTTETGGHDAPDGRGLRYVEWCWDPDPADDTCECVFAIILRDAAGQARVVEDRHAYGCFSRARWMEWFEEAGLVVRNHVDRWGRDVFVGNSAQLFGF